MVRAARGAVVMASRPVRQILLVPLAHRESP